MLGLSVNLALESASSMRIWRRLICDSPNRPTGMTGLILSTSRHRLGSTIHTGRDSKAATQLAPRLIVARGMSALGH
jgi:hypothetical protein